MPKGVTAVVAPGTDPVLASASLVGGSDIDAEAESAVADAGLSAQAIDGVVLVGGATRMPVIRQAVASHFGKPPYTGLDPDQVVALGAAMQAARQGSGPMARRKVAVWKVPAPTSMS